MALGEEPGKDGPTACWPCCLPDVHVLLQLGLGRDGAVGEGRAAGNGAVALGLGLGIEQRIQNRGGGAAESSEDGNGTRGGGLSARGGPRWLDLYT